MSVGIYRITVVSTPNINKPILCDHINGVLVFGRFSNHEMSVTSEELELAFTKGYNIFIHTCLISDCLGTPYVDYITTAYCKRKEYKALMK